MHALLFDRDFDLMPVVADYDDYLEELEQERIDQSGTLSRDEWQIGLFMPYLEAMFFTSSYAQSPT